MNSRHALQTGIFTTIFLFAATAIAQDVASKDVSRRKVTMKESISSSPGPIVTASPDNNAPAEVVRPSASSQFQLGPSDVIHINVWKNVELSQTVTVGPDGFVSLPLLGDVHVAGMTVNELGQALATKLNSFVMNPQVTVSVVDIRSRQVFVLGQVAKPGGYSLITPVNILQLIALAGGLSNFANKKEITVLRPKPGGTQKITFNYNNAVRGDSKQNIDLLPGDTVIVR